MKLITLACPNCHAQLQVNRELKQASCNYCGYGFLIDDEISKAEVNIQNAREVGREMEYGRRSISGANEQLVSEVGYVKDHIAIINELMLQARSQSKQIELTKKICYHLSLPVVLILMWFFPSWS